MRIRSIALRPFVVAVVFSLLLPEANAAPADPSALVIELGAQAKLVLNDAALTPIERQERFRALLDQDVDFPTIARFVLGRYWQGSSDPFRQQFIGVFEEYVIQSLTAGLGGYAGESIDVTGTRVEGERSTIVSTTITLPNGGPAEIVDWRVQNTPTGYKIADVAISGVSMAIAYRDQFAAVIDRNGGQVTALIPALRQKLNGQPSDSAAGGPQAKSP